MLFGYFFCLDCGVSVLWISSRTACLSAGWRGELDSGLAQNIMTMERDMFNDANTTTRVMMNKGGRTLRVLRLQRTTVRGRKLGDGCVLRVCWSLLNASVR